METQMPERRTVQQDGSILPFCRQGEPLQVPELGIRMTGVVL